MAADLEVSIGVDVDELNNGLNSASKKFEEFGKKMTSIGSAMSLAITTPLLLIGKQMIKLASDSQEATNKVEVAFGKSADAVKEFASTSLTQFGIAKGSAMDMASTYGDMSTSMGLTQEQAASLSTSLVGLAADLASFKNIGIEQANTALKGIFTGETESLKTLGIVMTEANLKAYALSKGFKGNAEDLTQAEKVLLRYNYVLANTTNSQGDFARTGGGAANQMRMFGESLKEIGDTFGTTVLPSFTKGITLVNNFMKEFAKLDSETKKNIIIGSVFVAAIGPTLVAIGALITAVKTIGVAIAALNLPIIAVIALIAALAYGASENFSTLKTNLHTLNREFYNFERTMVRLLRIINGNEWTNNRLMELQEELVKRSDAINNIGFGESIQKFVAEVKKANVSMTGLLDFTGKTSGKVETGVTEKQIKDAGYKRLEAFKKMHSDEMRERDKQFSERLKKEREYALEMEKILSLEDLPAVNPISLNFSEEQSLNITGLKSDLGQEIGGLSDFLLNNWNNLRSRFSELNLPEFPSNQKIFEKLKIDWTDGIDDAESEMIEGFLKMRDVLKGVMDIVSNTLGDTFSGIFESMFDKDVKFDFKKVLGSFLKAMGQMAISMGAAILAVGLGLSASVVGTAVAGKEVAAGLGLIALGGALMGGGSAIGNNSNSSVSTSTGARNIVPFQNPSGFNNTVKFEIQGNTLVGVLNNVNRANG
jgi:hypothetical protein